MPFPSVENLLHDEWIGVKLGEQNKIKLLNKKLFSYRIHEKQYTNAVWQKNTPENKMKFRSVLEGSACLYPLNFYKHFNRKLVWAFGFQKLGINVSDEIIGKIKNYKKGGLICVLKEMPFLKRKWRLLKLFLGKSEQVSVYDVFFI